MIRHELFEAMESHAFKKANPSHTGGLPAKVFAKEIEPGRVQSKGLHLSPRVLSRESEMVRKNPHLARRFHSIRGSSGESAIMKRITGKRYGMDKMTARDHLRAHNAPADTIINVDGVPTAAFKDSLPKADRSGLLSRLAAQFKHKYGE